MGCCHQTKPLSRTCNRSNRQSPSASNNGIKATRKMVSIATPESVPEKEKTQQVDTKKGQELPQHNLPTKKTRKFKLENLFFLRVVFDRNRFKKMERHDKLIGCPHIPGLNAALWRGQAPDWFETTPFLLKCKQYSHTSFQVEYHYRSHKGSLLKFIDVN